METEKQIVCREETANDYDWVEEVIKSDKYREQKDSVNNEWNNVRRLRNNRIFDKRFSLVAEQNDRIVGHILFVDAPAVSAEQGKKYLNFIQQSIHAQYQGIGIGTKLVRAIETIAENMGYSGIFAFGHAEYFPHLGYEQITLPEEYRLLYAEDRPLFYKHFGKQESGALNEFFYNAGKLYDIRDFKE